jgi:hypothetical protein
MEDKIEQFWRDATADDVARVMKGQAVWARFRDSENTSWYLRELRGWNTGVFICSQSEAWRQCKVYDPPEWYVNKPDPGEGWRVLEKFPSEAKLGTDEAWQKLSKCWKTVMNDNGLQSDTTWYRRRIANNPVTPDSSNYSEIPNSCEVVAYEATEGELIELPSGKRIRITAKGFEVV